VPVEVKVHDNVEEPEPPVTVAGDRVQAVLSLVSATSAENPLMGAIVMVEVPGVPTIVVTVEGDALIAKSATVVTV
jgi:hypothetical protein